MTDDLRTRIKEEVLDGILSMFSENDSVEMAAGYIADAVIRELGLKVEYGMSGQHDYSGNPEIHPVSKQDMEYRSWYGEDFTYRYITDWEGNHS